MPPATVSPPARRTARGVPPRQCDREPRGEHPDRRRWTARWGWTEREYLALQTNYRVEFVDGELEFLPMPTKTHEDLGTFLFMTLYRFAEARDLGTVRYSGTRVRQHNGKYRLPDVLFMRAEHDHRRTESHWVGADFALEVVSDDDPDRDLVEKRAEYARTGIPEYWIADPRDRSLTVLVLDEGADEYREAGRYADGDVAACVTLPGLTVDVTACFDAA